MQLTGCCGGTHTHARRGCSSRAWVACVIRSRPSAWHDLERRASWATACTPSGATTVPPLCRRSTCSRRVQSLVRTLPGHEAKRCLHMCIQRKPWRCQSNLCRHRLHPLTLPVLSNSKSDRSVYSHPEAKESLATRSPPCE
jgi:hypothetical protein